MLEAPLPPLPQPIKPNTTSDSDKNIIIAAKGGSVTFAGNLFTYANRFIFSLIVARMLGAEQFGLYTLALSIVMAINAFTTLGLEGGMARFIPIALKEKNKAKVWGVIQVGTGIPFVISLVITLFILLTADWLATGIFEEPQIAFILRLMALIGPIGVITDSLSTIAQGYKQLQYDVYTRDIAFNLLKLVLSVALLIFGLGVLGITIAYIVAAFISMILLFFFVHRHIFSFARPINSAERNAGELFRFSFPLYLSRLLNNYGSQFETLILGVFGVVSQVGIYAAILNISQIGNMFFSSLRKISIPVISELYSQDKIDELKQFYQTTTKWSLTFNLPVFLTIALFSSPLLSIFGEDFTAGATGLLILAAAALFNGATGNCGTVINMTGYSRLGLVNSIVYFLATVILDFLLIPRYELVGAALAGALTIVIINTLRMGEVYYLIKGLLPYNLTFWKPLFAGLMTAGVTYSLTQLFFIDWPFVQFMVLAPLMWLIYIATIFVLKLSDEDRLILDKLQGRLKRPQRKT